MTIVNGLQGASSGNCYQLPATPSNTGLIACFEYYLVALPSAKPCTIKASKLGSFVIIAAHIQESTAPSIQVALTSQEMTNLSSATSSAQAETSQDSTPACQLYLDSRTLSKLHMQLESGLVLPLMKQYYAESGQALPSGLMGLRGGLAAQPAELLSHILSHLDVSQALCCPPPVA